MSSLAASAIVPEVLATMSRRNVRERAKSDLYAADSPRTLLASNRVDLPHQIGDALEFVHSSKEIAHNFVHACALAGIATPKAYSRSAGAALCARRSPRHLQCPWGTRHRLRREFRVLVRSRL